MTELLPFVNRTSGLYSTLHVHRLGAVTTKVEATLLGTAGSTESKLLLSTHGLIAGLVLVREVLLDDVVRLHVNLFVGVGLAVVDLLHASALLDKQSITVNRLGALASSVLVKLANLENVLKTIKGNLDNLVVGAGKKVAERLDAALSNQVPDLIRLLKATRSRVADSPASLLTGLEVGMGKKVDQRRDNVGVNDRLDLGRVSSSDVADGPASLLANTILVGAQQGQEARKGTAVDDNLGLNIISSDNVTDGTKRGGLDGGGGVHQKLNKTPGNASFNNGLDLVIRTIREVRNSPAGVDEDLVVERVDELGENRQGGSNL